MEIHTVDRGDLVDVEVATFAQRRLLFALSRFDTKIDNVVLTVNDINGPKGGIDKECQIHIKMHRGQEIIITDVDEDVKACIARAADRAGRTVSRRLERQRDASRRARLPISFGEML